MLHAGYTGVAYAATLVHTLQYISPTWVVVVSYYQYAYRLQAAFELNLAHILKSDSGRKNFLNAGFDE